MYSNLGFVWLGRICEALDGRPFVDQVRTALLAPLGLAATDFTPPAERTVATGYARTSAGWEAQEVTVPGAFSPMAGLFSTANDLIAWLRFLAAPAGDDDADAVLPHRSRRELLRPQRLIPARGADGHPSAYACGMIVEDHLEHRTVYSHSGGYPGFSAHMRLHGATGIAVVGFENGRYSGVRPAVAASLDVALDAVASGELVLDGAPGTVPPAPART